MNSVETILFNLDERGKSLKSIIKELKLSKRDILYQIYMSKNIINANPRLYGSGKFYIKAFRFIDDKSNLNYIQRLRPKKKVTQNVADVTQNVADVQIPDQSVQISCA